MILFTNTLTGKKEEFKTQKTMKVSLYVCGVTPYDLAHIGHGRCYVTFDLIYRFLQFYGFDVTYCRNFTDIDDKILKRASQELGNPARYREITHKYIQAFNDDMLRLNCVTPTVQPRVTEMINEIIVFVQGLLDNGAAYEQDGSVYFRVTRFAEYGRLSKQNIDQLLLGARVDVNESKENPLDFVLWKRDDIVGFASPWGQGRPGWHIECSAMAQKTFDSTIDIHGGGMDLIFPHHENEIAQSQSLYPQTFVRYWVHNAFVRINEEKMSKSLGNFFTLQDSFKEFDPMVIRFYFLKQHYRNPLDFSLLDLEATEKAYRKIVNFFNDVALDDLLSIEEVKKNMIVEEMLECLKDDMNTSAVFAILFEKMNMLQKDIVSKKMVKYFLIHVFGLTLNLLPEKEVLITPEIQNLLDQREKARVEKKWKLADEIRDQLREFGVVPQDKKSK